jgi:hypothetical protein
VCAIAVVCAPCVAKGAPAAPSCQRLQASLAEIDKGTKLSDIQTRLVDETSRYVDRTAVFILKDGAAVGWTGRGFADPEAVKSVSIPLAANPLFRGATSSGSSHSGSIAQSPETAAALRRLGGQPRGLLVVPIVLLGKVRAVLYCDTVSEEVPAENAAAIRILALFSAKTIDVSSLTPAAKK